MKSGLVLIAAAATLLLGAGCGSSGTITGGEAVQGHKQTRAQLKKRHKARKHARHQAKKERKKARHRAKARARKVAHRRHVRHQHRLEVRQEHQEEREQRQLAMAEARDQREAEKEEAAPEEECDPNYTGACLLPNVSDYDCEGGDGNGPYYTGEVTVVGVDHYGLDADGDGIGCEAE
jgi:membrane-bound lytic murein transglycosylase